MSLRLTTSFALLVALGPLRVVAVVVLPVVETRRNAGAIVTTDESVAALRDDSGARHGDGEEAEQAYSKAHDEVETDKGLSGFERSW